MKLAASLAAIALLFADAATAQESSALTQAARRAAAELAKTARPTAANQIGAVATQAGPGSVSMVTVGTRVRIRPSTFGGRVVGTVMAFDRNGITIAGETGAIVVPIASIAELDVSLSRKRQWLKGMAFGAAIGVASGFAVDVDPELCEFDSDYACSRGEAIGYSVVGAATVFTTVGALVKRDRWLRVETAGLADALPQPAPAATVSASPARVDSEPLRSAAAAAFGLMPIYLKPGDPVRVTDTAGNVLAGPVTAVSASAFEVAGPGGNGRRFGVDDVAIVARGGDSLKNGALKGLAVSGSIGALLGVAAWASGEEGPIAALVVLSVGGAGAAIGAGVDALVVDSSVIFAAPARRTTSLTVSPLIGRDRKGVMVSMRF